jgi:hypothetical protein
VKVNSVTSSASFPKGGLMARDSTAVGSRFVFCGHQESATPKAKFRIRATTDASSQDLATVPVTSTTWYRLTRSGNSWQCDYSSDSQAWLPAFNAVVQELSGQALVGLAVTGNNGTSTNALYQFQNLGITTGTASISADVATTVAATIKVRARDNDINTSAFSATTTVTPLSSSPPATGAKRFHPGHYLKTTGNPHDNDQEAYITETISKVNARVNDAEILGSWVALSWGNMEPSQGVFDFTDLNRLYNVHASQGKYMALQIPYKSFASDVSKMTPPDLSSKIYLTTREGTTTSIVAVWEPAVMDRFIALTEAVAAEMDDKEYFEIVTWAETSPSLQGETPPNYSKAGYATQLKRLYDAAVPVFEKTNVWPGMNFLSGQICGTDGLMEHAYQNNMGRWVSDLRPDSGQDCWAGTLPESVRDYRTQLGFGAVISYSVLNGKSGNTTSDTPAGAITYALDMDVTHLFWYPSYNNPARPGRTWTDILAAIAAATSPNDISDAACPTVYTANLGGCTP